MPTNRRPLAKWLRQLTIVQHEMREWENQYAEAAKERTETDYLKVRLLDVRQAMHACVDELDGVITSIAWLRRA